MDSSAYPGAVDGTFDPRIDGRLVEGSGRDQAVAPASGHRGRANAEGRFGYLKTVSEAAEDGPSTVVGEQRTQRPSTRTQVIGYIAVCAVIALEAVHGRFDFVLLYLPIGLAVQGWLRRRPPTVVSAEGVRRPWRRIAFVDWTDVAAVGRPQLGVWAASLILVNGKRVVLDDIAADRSAAIAQIGQKELSAPTVVQLPAAASPYRVRTPMEIEADVTRQAAVLAQQREWLAAESRRLRRPP